MKQRGIRRRTLLATAGSLVALGGCLGGDDDSTEVTPTSTSEGEPSSTPTEQATETPTQPSTTETVQFDELETAGTELPGYTDLVETQEPGWTVIRANFDKVAGVRAYSPLTDTAPGGILGSGGEPIYPFIDGVAEEVPATAAASTALVYSALLSRLPVVTNVDAPWQGTNVSEGNRFMQLEGLTVTNAAVQLEGPVDHESLAALESVQQEGESAGLTIYTAESENGEQSFAAGDSQLLVPPGVVNASASEELDLEPVLDTLRAMRELPPGIGQLLKSCGDGAFVYAGPADETDGSPQLLQQYGSANEETVERYRTLLEPVTTMVLVAEGHERGRVTRTGLEYESPAAVPDAGRFRAVFVPEAENVRVAVDGNLVLIEAFR